MGLGAVWVRWIGLAGVWFGLLMGPGPAGADELDWSEWRRLPVFAEGRIMPLDSFARSAVERICGRARPRLGLAEALPGEDLSQPEYADARKLFPEGKARIWEPYELIFSWLVESQRWERAPFLVGQHHQLREEILGLPREDQSGRAIKYVSPWQVEQAKGFWQWRQDLRRRRQEADQTGEKFQPTGVDRKAAQLLEAYHAWRELTFSAQSLASPESLFQTRLAELHDVWMASGQAMEQAIAMGNGPRQAIEEFPEALEALRNLVQQRPVARPRMEAETRRLRRTAQQLADWFDDSYRRLRRSPPPIRAEQWRQMESHWAALVSRTRDLLRLSWEVQTALFDNIPASGGDGDMVRLVPSLNPFALEEARTPEENPQPWLTWQAVLEASLRETLAEYPAEEIQAVREAFREAADAYQNRTSPNRAERFSAAMKKFSHSLRRLGEAINQARQNLPVRKLDTAALQATQYPPPGATDLEVHYNQTDPFRAGWMGYLAAAVGFALSFGRLRRPMFWLGIALLGLAQFFILYGLGLRYAITGWAPVTNMFETVVVTALTVGMMGWVLALWPLLGPGLRIAWQWTAWPISWRSAEAPTPPSPSLAEKGAGGVPPSQEASSAAETGRKVDKERPLLSSRSAAIGRWVLAPLRIVLMAVVFYGLTQVHYGEGEGYTVVSLAPRVERGGSLTANDLAAWAAGWAFLLGSMWYAPRALLTAVASLWITPLGWFRQGVREACQQAEARKVYAFSGALMGLLGALLAYYAPPTILDKSIGPLRPVLRDNFWLTAHVVTITASYGAGALALALGNLALFHYLFGRYQTVGSEWPVEPFEASEPSRPTRRAPPPCQTLAQYIYRSMQVAVLLLAAGTLLGALWADVAWGRFWGWDAKEVWALISLLVYMAVLHGRYIGWFGDFGLAAFSVLGATSILMTWYGVNYVLDVGLHSYGRGTGGLGVVLAVVAANWLFLAAAAVRYSLETRTPKDVTS